ncbi:unnamed protein product, partial [Pleuronectes platessa]
MWRTDWKRKRKKMWMSNTSLPSGPPCGSSRCLLILLLHMVPPPVVDPGLQPPGQRQQVVVSQTPLHLLLLLSPLLLHMVEVGPVLPLQPAPLPGLHRTLPPPDVNTDLSKGYWQVPLARISRKLTAFRTPWGLFQAAPLTDMTGSRCPNQVQWTEVAEAAFRDIQLCLDPLRTARGSGEQRGRAAGESRSGRAK